MVLSSSFARTHGAILRGFAGTLAFESLLAAHIDFDLLGLGFSLFGQGDLQHALIVVCRNLLGIHGGGQIEGAGEAAILTLHTAVVLFFFFLLDLALAVDGEGVVLDADVDIFFIDAGTSIFRLTLCSSS